MSLRGFRGGDRDGDGDETLDELNSGGRRVERRRRRWRWREAFFEGDLHDF